MAQDDVWLSLFEPTGAPDVDVDVVPALPDPRRPPSDDRFEHRSVLSGVGWCDLGRRLGRDPLSLTVDACLAAVADAGLTLDDIGGLSTYPGAGPMGMSEGGVSAVEEALRLRPTWINGGMELPGPARRGGDRRHARRRERSMPPRPVLPHRLGVDLRSVAPGPTRRGAASGASQWRAPFGAVSPANWIGMNANQYLHRYGATRELFGTIAVNARTGAGRNPHATTATR